jgi:hypothetical protein
MTFLSAAELIELTGYKRPSRQIYELRRMKIPYFLNGRNRPVVAKVSVAGAPYAPYEPIWSPAVLASPSASR